MLYWCDIGNDFFKKSFEVKYSGIDFIVLHRLLLVSGRKKKYVLFPAVSRSKEIYRTFISTQLMLTRNPLRLISLPYQGAGFFKGRNAISVLNPQRNGQMLGKLFFACKLFLSFPAALISL